MSSSTTNVLSANPFSQFKSTVNLDPKTNVVSNMPDEVATLIFSKMRIEQVQVVMENTNTLMDRYSLYRNLVSAKASLNGTELGKYQLLLSMQGQTLIAGGTPALKPWADLLKDHPMSLGNLKHFDLSDLTNIGDEDLIALTKDCKNLTKLILPGVFPSVAVMAVLRENCPQAAIYPTAMTEYEWSHPAEFMAKLQPPPKEVADFINGPHPIWEGKTSAQVHMVMPKVNKIVRNINGKEIIEPWTLDNVIKLDKATRGLGCNTWRQVLEPDVDKPSEVGFEWVVFTKDILPGSLDQSYAHQKGLIEHWGYEMPGLIDAVTSILWEYRISGNRIYSDDPFSLIRCKEMIGDSQTIVGNFNARGLYAFFNLSNSNRELGIAGIRKFTVHRQLI